MSKSNHHHHHDDKHGHASGSCCCPGEDFPEISEAEELSLNIPLPDNARTSRFLIENMDCPVEERLIRKKLANLAGIVKLEFNLLERVLTVYHTSSNTTEIVLSLNAIDMSPRELEKSQPRRPEKAGLAIPMKTWWVLGVSGAAAIGSEIVAWITGVENSPLIIALALFSIFACGLPTLKKGWIALRSLTLNISFLMSLAVIGAIVIGQWPEAAVVIWLFTIAEKIEALSLDRARNAIRNLMAIAPETAMVRGDDGNWQEVEAVSVNQGQFIRVRPGERIPLDGVVVTGRSSVNQSPITGESMPIDKTSGDPVFAGTVNENGTFEFQVTGDYEHTTLSRIIAAVQKAQAERAPAQRFVDAFARYYTPSVVAIALLIAIFPPLILGAAWGIWIYKALVLLVISCPCALVISTPVTVVSGLAAAAHHGILIKGGVYLEGGRKLQSLALDKTGTLTLGKPTVTDLIPLNDLDAGAMLHLVASLDEHAGHPIACAIVQYWKDSGDSKAMLQVDNFRNLPGRGVSGEIGGHCYYLGNQRLVEELGVYSSLLEQELKRLEKQGKTAVVLTDAKLPLAVIGVADTLRETSRQAVTALQALGVKVVMLSGDNDLTAKAIGQSVGIDDARGNLLPEDKLNAIADLQQHGLVGMVGDGINDAPALAKANIGFAMGAAGTATALETADVALMDDDLRKLPDFIRLSRQTWSILTQNVTLAISTKAVFFALALVGEVTLWMAVFADMGLSLLVVFNSLRLLNFFNGEKP
jgi:Zn2+/Cd2+-exporting ATPase